MMQIRSGGATQEAQDAVGLLLACHERIRRFCALAIRVGDAARGGADAVPADDLAAAAADVRRYFVEALPRHADDEDLSLRPLLAPVVPAAVADAMGRAADEHGPIHALLAELAPLWAAVAREPESAARHAEALRAGAAGLDSLFHVHLPPEETLIFPAIRTHLSPEAQATLLAAMRARRSAQRPVSVP